MTTSLVRQLSVLVLVVVQVAGPFARPAYTPSAGSPGVLQSQCKEITCT